MAKKIRILISFLVVHFFLFSPNAFPQIIPTFPQNINNCFLQISATCPDCKGCPPLGARTIQGEIQAKTDSPRIENINAANVKAVNYMISSLILNPISSVAADDVIATTITGEVIECKKFSVFFDLVGSIVLPELGPIADWNDADTQLDNNCYNYATNIETDHFSQPGIGGGTPFAAFTCPDVRKAAESDGLLGNVVINDLCGGTTRSCLANGGHIVALVIAPPAPTIGFPGDFHWYRQESDGTWTHKPGSTPATPFDNDSKLITNPETADRGPYTQFCGYFCVGQGVMLN